MDLLNRFGVYPSVPTGYNGPDGTNYYVPITIQASEVPSALTDFPVYVDLSTMPTDFWSNVQSDGGDIRVTTSDGVTRVPVELVSIDTASESGELHFLATSVSGVSDTEFRLFYDAETALSQPGVTDTYGRNAVWSEYEFVSHDGGLTDSTGSHMPTNNGTTNSIGKIGEQARSFDGKNDYILVSGAGGVSNDITKQAWFKTTSGGRVMANGSLTTVYWSVGISDGKYRVTGNVFDGSNNYYGGDVTNVDSGSWALAHFSVSKSAGVGNLYVNGNLVSSQPGGASFTTHPTLRLGSHRIGVNWFGGSLDEVRTRAESLNANWILAEYRNQETPLPFYNVGTQTQA